MSARSTSHCSALSPKGLERRTDAASRRQARQLDAVLRFEAWAQRERTGRTDSSRREARELNHLLRRWFTQVTIAIQPMGLTFEAELAGALRTAEARFNRREWMSFLPIPQRRHQLHRYWDKPEILGALRWWAAEHGRTPRSMDWHDGGVEYPSSLTVRRQFKRWSTAVRLAGLKPAVLHWRPEWSDEDILKALQGWAVRYGRPPERREWLRSGPKRPCRATVCARFGTWQAALLAAGLAS
jgi:hypothetical protein